VGKGRSAQRFDQARLITLANGLTALRILLLPLFASLLVAGRFRKGLLVFLLCGLTDLLDGLLARLLRQRSVVGFYLDPIADKLLMATAFVVLAYVGAAPVWFAILVISRDLFILIGSILILLLIGSRGISPTPLSKANTAVQVLTVVYLLAVRAFPEGRALLATGADLLSFSGIVVGTCAATTALSGIQYLVVGIRRLSGA